MSRGLKAFFWVVFAMVGAVSAAPLLRLFSRLITRTDYFPILFEDDVLDALLDTVQVVFLSLILGLTMALPLSWLVMRSDLPGRRLFRKVFLFPYLLPPYLYAIAWMMLAIPTVGFLNRWGNSIIGENSLFNIYSMGGLVWVLSCAYLPILLASICSALESMDPSLEEAARVSGAGPLETTLRITFPCLLPATASASLLYGLVIMAAFGIPSLVGGPAKIHVLTTQIYAFVKLGGLEGLDHAVVVSIWLFLFALALIFVNSWVKKRYLARLVVGKSARPSLVRLGKARTPALLFSAAFGLILVVLPLASVFLSSFLKVQGELSFSNLTLNNYRYILFEMPEFYVAVKNSVYLAGATGFLCVLLAFFVAFYHERMPGAASSTLQFIASFPFAIPGAVVALAAIVSFGSGWGIPQLALLGSSLLLLIAYVSKYLALAVQNIGPALASIHPSLDEAGRVSGAGPWRVIFQILLPILMPVLLSVYFLTALPVLSELTMSVLLSGPGLETIGTQLFTLYEYANPLGACAMASLLIFALILIAGFVKLLERAMRTK